ncbi:hypothetical protein PV08_05091 [Exophiala spinifera]|uniref:Uncharacterized protein n=1 Tax=Exophiala spinifera TaxID=91928 RepID=A0A0D1YRM3_9EURO|nr:uncharacterized protein PV08_05091 [Exophiala spinifera]KIW17896.1 hypothetical protein PV08_05091 [Exophiala spinifera]
MPPALSVRYFSTERVEACSIADTIHGDQQHPYWALGIYSYSYCTSSKSGCESTDTMRIENEKPRPHLPPGQRTLALEWREADMPFLHVQSAHVDAPVGVGTVDHWHVEASLAASAFSKRREAVTLLSLG